MDYPIFVRYLLAILPFVVLIYVLILSSSKKTPINKKIEKPPIGSGWVYFLERDGHIKVGHVNYYDKEGLEPIFEEENKFVQRMKEYLNYTSQPNLNNVNIFYYNFLPDAELWDDRLRHILLGYAVEIDQKYYAKLDNMNGFSSEKLENGNLLLINIFNNCKKLKPNDQTKLVDSVQSQFNMNELYESHGALHADANERLNAEHPLKNKELAGEINNEIPSNPYFGKIHTDDSSEWFKINDVNHRETQLAHLYTILDTFKIIDESTHSIISKTNSEIFDQPRIFLSRMPK